MINAKKLVDLRNDDKEVLDNILARYQYTFYAYGSRVKGCSRKYSDLDLCYFDNIPSMEVMEIKWALEDSDMSIKVSITSVSEFSASFFKSIEKDLVELEIDRN